MIPRPQSAGRAALIRTTAIAAVVVFGWAEIASAQIDVLHAFPAPGAVRPRAGLLLAADGNFYGTTLEGGAADKGTAFSLTPAGVFTHLHSFGMGSDGAYPYAPLIQAADGNFYGTTFLGGTLGVGTVFRMTPAGTVTTLHNFSFSTSGNSPYGELVQAGDGNFYGTTSFGGASNQGTAFRLTPAGVFTVLHAFAGGGGGADGSRPRAGLVLASDGNLYGTTYEGGISGAGTVFRMTPAGVVTVLHAFAGGDADGAYPHASLIQATDGSLYGTTTGGGPSSSGTAFKITLGGTFTLLHAFTGGADGSGVYAPLEQGPDGHFYGTATFGGASFLGVVFQMTAAGAVTVLHTCTTANGAIPYGALVTAADGSFYGTTYSGGAFNAGTVFQVTSGGAFTLRRSFTGGPDGARPRSSLIRATDGNLYGTTTVGGTADLGTVYKITPGGAVTILHSFIDIFDGSRPVTGLVQANDGNFYGTSGFGNRIFKLTPGGTFTALHTLDYATDGYYPSTLIQGSDGNVYGTAQYGGPSNLGTAFKVTLAGAFTRLHSFTGGADGAAPSAALVQANDGNFYGTTANGGAANSGTVFRMTPGGTVTILHTFTSGADGQIPNAPLIQAPDGNLYGTTTNGGTGGGAGTIFRTDLTGAGYTTLHAFAVATGGLPYGPVLRAPDGNFYGTTTVGGASDVGSVYRMTPAGSVTVLHTFNAANGGYPYAGLVRAPGGHFYGTTQDFGPHGVGEVFHFFVAPPAFRDDPLVAGATAVRAVHITELRSRIDAARFAKALGAFPDTDPTIVVGATTIKVQHMLDLRTALSQLYVASGLSAPAWADPGLAAGTTIKAEHIAEIRAALLAIE